MLIVCLGFTLNGCNTKERPYDNQIFLLLDAKEIGIGFENQLSYSEDFNIYLYKSFYNGAGVGMGDFNNDGHLDVFFCGNQVDNKLYMGKGGFQFIDATKVAGVASRGSWSTGVSVVDINHDGWLDIYVCKSGRPDSENRRNNLYINSGKPDENGFPIFVDKAHEWGIDDLGFSVNATFFDYDRDGDLDMYLLNNSINPSKVVLDAKKGLRQIYDPNGGNKLYKNIGGRFVDVTVEAGIYGSAIGFGLGASVGDINKDGWPDIYIANDFFEKDYLYYNNKNGTFTEAIETSMAEMSQGSMGVDIADLNNDGWQDIFVTEMLPDGNERVKTKVLFDDWNTYQLRIRNGYHRQFPRNTLQLNQGKISSEEKVAFSEISRLTGTAATEWSWGVHILDLNNDTHKEIYITNGIVKDLLDQDYIDFYNNADKLRQMYEEKGAVIKELVDNIPSGKVANYLYQNQNENLKFVDVAENWGLGTPSFSTGAAFGDLDNDGDLDLVVNNLNDGPFIYQNQTNGSRNHLTIKLQGDKANLQATGSQVTLYANEKIWFQEAYPVRGTMSTMDNRLHFGLAEYQKIDSIQVVWPSGGVSKRYNIGANQFLTINQSEAQQKKGGEYLQIEPMPVILNDVTAFYDIDFEHSENKYLDFDRDNLRFRSIATEGPSVAVADVNNDGKNDFFICGAKGQPGHMFERTAEGGFRLTNQSLFEKDGHAEDVNAVFADIDNDGDQDLLVAAAGYEYPSSSFSLANRIYVNDGSGNFGKSSQIIPMDNLADTSCIFPSDIDKDGDLDLFIGTRAVPLSYGVPPSSFLLINDGEGNFTDQTRTRAPGLVDVGMVTDAAWLDFDRDGDQDLVMVGEFMPIKLFENRQGNFVEKTVELGLGKTHGLWNAVAIKDLDNDGYEDIVAANFGLNNFYQASVDKPLTLFINDFDNNGAIDHVLCKYEEGKLYPIPTKKDITSQMPYLSKSFVKHSEYANATVQDVFTEEKLEEGITLKANYLESMVFWNNKGNFEMVALPIEAQLTSNYAIFLDDMDADGLIDILLGGNLFRIKPQLGIQAGNYGMFLKGGKNRRFEPLSYSESGFYVSGEIRDIKLLESPNDKKSILVARNNDGPKVFNYEDGKQQ